MVYRNGQVQAVTFGSNVPSGITSEVEFIEIGRSPFQTTYMVGDTFNPEGLIVLAHFTNGEIEYVPFNKLLFSHNTLQDTSIQSIEIQYAHNDKTVSISLPVRVVSTMCFGVMWDYAQAETVLTRLTPSSDPNHLVTIRVNEEPHPETTVMLGSSPFDNYAPWNKMEEYNIVNNQVKYKKGRDPQFSRIDYDTMVYIPKFYYRVIDDPGNSKRYWYISENSFNGASLHPGSNRYIGRYNTTVDYKSCSGSLWTSQFLSTYRNKAREKGSGWNTWDYTTVSAVILLYLIEYADWNSQARIGAGVYRSSSGGTDSMTYHTGTASTGSVQYRGIESLWGGAWQLLDGFLSVDRVVYVCETPSKCADIVGDGYINTGVSLPNATRSFIMKLWYSNAVKWSFIPSELGGSDKTYIPDYLYTGSGTLYPLYGGQPSNGAGDGIMAMAVDHATNTTYSGATCRMIFKPS